MIKISISIILCLTTISFIFPMFSFFFMAIFMGFFLITLFPYKMYDSFFEDQKTLIRKFLILLEALGILDFLATLYILFFFVPKKIFNIRMLLIVFFSVIYIIATRYCFIHLVLLHESFSYITNFFLYLILFIGISLTYSRFLLNLALFVVPLTLQIEPKLLSEFILYIFGQGEDMASESTPKPQNKMSFINFTYTRATYRQYFTSDHTKMYRNIGLGLGFLTFFATSFAAYYSKVQADAAIIQAVQAKIQADAAIIQAEQAKVQTYHTAREADVAAVEAKLITLDEYYKRHPEDKPKS